MVPKDQPRPARCVRERVRREEWQGFYLAAGEAAYWDNHFDDHTKQAEK